MAVPMIHITGASGSGTTTLGRAVAGQLGHRSLDADVFYWVPTTPPYQEKRSREERRALLAAELDDPTVLSGSIVGWGPTLEDAWGLIVYLWVPPDVRLARLRRRERAVRGTVDEQFLAWAARYDTGGLDVRSRALHERWLAERSCPVLRIEGTPPVDESLRRVLDAVRAA